MNIYKWVVVALLAWSALNTVFQIGTTRKVVTPADAVGSLVLSAAVIALVVLA